MSVRVGTVFLPGWAPELLHPTVTAAERGGLDDLWLWEDCFSESGVASAVASLAWSERLHVGIGLMPAPLRNVAITAMEIATIDRLFPGRFTPAIGHGVQDWMAQVGARADSPMTLLREYATALRRLLDGEKVAVDGRYVHLDEVALDWPPLHALPLVIGGVGPRTLALAAELGDGTMFTGALTEENVRASVDAVRAATPDTNHQIVAHLMAARGPDARQLLDTELGMWPESSTGSGVAGSAAEVAAAIDRFAALGATTVLVHSVTAEVDPAGYVAWVGSDVLPLVTARS